MKIRADDMVYRHGQEAAVGIGSVAPTLTMCCRNDSQPTPTMLATETCCRS